MRIGPVFTRILDCQTESARGGSKKKFFKGVKTLNWDFTEPPYPKISTKTLTQIGVTVSSSHKKGKNKAWKCLLRKATEMKKLSLKGLANGGYLFSRLLDHGRRFKKLTSFHLLRSACYPNRPSIQWAHELLKNFPKLEFFSCLFWDIEIKQEEFNKHFAILAKMSKLSMIHFDLHAYTYRPLIDRFWAILSAVPAINPKVSLSFQIVLWRTLQAADFDNIFHSANNKPQLKNMIAKLNNIAKDITEKSLVQFIETNPQLESLTLQMWISHPMQLSLPFYHLPQLRTLKLLHYNSNGLNKDNFSALLQNISKCKGLKELAFGLSSCENLNDEDTLNLKEAVIQLTNLQALKLVFEASSYSHTKWTTASLDTISQMLTQIPKLSWLRIDFSAFAGVEENTIKSFLEATSQLPCLKELRLAMRKLDTLTDKLFTEFPQTWERLFSQIERFHFNVWDCDNIKGDFLQPFSRILIHNKKRIQQFYLGKIKRPQTDDFEEVNRLVQFELQQNFPRTSCVIQFK